MRTTFVPAVVAALLIGVLVQADRVDGDVGGTRGTLFDVDVGASTGAATAAKDPRDYVLPTPPKDWLARSYDVCSVGAGLSGVVLAERYATLQGASVLVLDKRPHIAGNCYDEHHRQTGVLMNRYGAHLFHTNSERVWDYVTSFAKDNPAAAGTAASSAGTGTGAGAGAGATRWRRWDHRVLGRVDGRLVPIPVNINTVNALLDLGVTGPAEMDAWLASVQVAPAHGGAPRNGEEMALSRVGRDLYEKIFRTYTVKQWARDPRELDASVLARIPVRNNFDDRYFSDRHQALPERGYTHWFGAVLARNGPVNAPGGRVTAVTGVDFFDHKEALLERCGKVFYTGPIDRYFADAGLGTLEYRSIDFVERVLPSVGPGFFQPNSVVNYPGPEVGFTRIVEYKHFLHQQRVLGAEEGAGDGGRRGTVVVAEFSSSVGDPYYPVPNERNRALYARFQALAEKEERARGVHFVGRLANYKYFNMDAAILNALEYYDRLETGGKEVPA